MLASPVLGALGSRRALTWRRIQDSPQITAITIARPTIVRTRLAPEPLEWVLPADEPRLKGVFSPLPSACPLPDAAATPGHARATRQAPVAAAAVAAAR